MELDHLGGTNSDNRKSTPFMCLILKMLQIQPEKDIVVEFIKNEGYRDAHRDGKTSSSELTNYARTPRPSSRAWPAYRAAEDRIG